MQKLNLCCIVVCLLAACGKHHDKPGNPGPGQGPHGEVTRLKSAGANTYTYDSLGRLARIVYGASTTGRTDYIYTKDSILELNFDNAGQRQGLFSIYYINADTLTTRVRYILAPSVPAIFFDLTYDAQKRLTEEIVGDEGSAPDSHSFYYYSNGNLDSTKLFSVQTGHEVELTKYEYYTDKPDWLSGRYNGISFGGAGSVNLLKKMVQTQIGDTSIIEYSYEFDANSRPVKRHALLNGAPWFDLDYTWVTLQL